MKIAISATGPSLDSEIDPRFGRSEYFVIVEPETMQFETLRNPNLGAPSGAGISTAQLICNKGVGAVVTGKIGPKAHQVLSAAGVRMLTGVSGRIDEAIESFKSGKLVDRGDTVAAPGIGESSGTVPVMGKGAGRGMGMGRGMGRGMGCRGGRGMGMGAGRIGANVGRVPGDLDAEPSPPSAITPGNRDEMALLKQQAEALAKELGKIQQRIEQMEKK